MPRFDNLGARIGGLARARKASTVYLSALLGKWNRRAVGAGFGQRY